MSKDVESGRHLLVIEDDPQLSKMLTDFFGVMGYRVTPAQSGETGVKLAADERPDLVLLDIRLPDINGYEVCRRLRANRHTADVPVIFLTERRERESRLTGLELGAVDYVTKPFDIQELRLRVRNTLERSLQTPLVNPVTGLPEGSIVQERLAELLDGDQWGVVVIDVRGVDHFRDQYGFVAADDVTRAVAIILKEMLPDRQGDFIGHLAPHQFVIITDPGAQGQMARRFQVRLQESVRLFYPAMERSAAEGEASPDQLQVVAGALGPADGPFNTVADLQQALNR